MSFMSVGKAVALYGFAAIGVAATGYGAWKYFQPEEKKTPEPQENAEENGEYNCKYRVTYPSDIFESLRKCASFFQMPWTTTEDECAVLSFYFSWSTAGDEIYLAYEFTAIPSRMDEIDTDLCEHIWDGFQTYLSDVSDKERDIINSGIMQLIFAMLHDSGLEQ